MTYDELPEPIRYRMTREQFAWLSEGEKERLLDTETEPEPE